MSSTSRASRWQERQHRLRVGLLLDSTQVPSWVGQTIAEIAASEIAELRLVVLNSAAGSRQPSELAKIWRRRRHLLYEFYARLDKRLLPPAHDPFSRTSISGLTDGITTLEVRPRRARFSDELPDAAVDQIFSHQLDVILRFGFRILKGRILQAARFGVWSYHHDDPDVIRGGPPGFWEVMEAHAATGSVLQVLTEQLDAGRVLYRSWSPTHRRSVIRNRAHVYWTAASFVGRALRHLATHGDLPDPPREKVWRLYDSRLYRKPSNAQAAVVIGRFGVRAVAEWAADRISRKQWFLAYRLENSEDVSRPTAPSLELFRFRPLIPPPDRFWADPFPVRHDGQYFIFFEEYDYGRRRGHLRALRIDRELGPRRSVAVLEEPFHLSHPFLFRHRGELFLVPESAAAGQVRVYRCTGFPNRWTLESTLLDGVPAVDATLHREGNEWWMFANMAPEGASHPHDELHLFHALDPLGPWGPVSGNPVKSDARGARPAGSLFRWRGHLYRPAQDCSGRYGRAVVFQRVLRLDHHGYAEEAVARIEPQWFPGLLANHTINREGPLTVVDGMRRRWGWVPDGAGRMHLAT